MIPDFETNRPYIENEFENACYDPASGMDIDTLRDGLVQFYRENADLPSPILRAKGIAFVLDNARIEINPRQIFADKLDTGVNYSGFASPDIVQNHIFGPRRDRILRENIPENYARACKGSAIGLGMPFTDFWHTVPDWNRVLKLGLPGFLAEAKAAKAALADTPENAPRAHFYESIILCFEAAIRYVKRLHAASLAYDLPDYSACLAALTERAPENFYEVLEYTILFVYFSEIGCERARTLGPVDRLWAPYIEADLVSGRFTREEICEMLRYFFIHFTATKRFAEQPMQIGGADENGNTFYSDITRLILEVYDGMNIYDPKIHVRVHRGMPDDILTKLLDMIRRGHSSICLLSDEAVIPGMMRTGVSREDAAQYVALGCYEPIVMGKEEAEIGAAWLNLAKPLEFALHSGRDVMSGTDYGVPTPADFDTFDAFMDAFFAQLDAIIEFTVESCILQDKYAVEVNPTPFYSATMAACMERGMDVHEHPLPYNNISLKFFALATVVDSLTMVKKLVFDEKRLSFPALAEILRNNWEGEEKLRLAIRRDPDKYGNNRELPDEIMVKIVDHIVDKLDHTDTGRGGKFRVGLDSINNCVGWGRQTGATPDGRKQGEPTSKNLCASAGMDREGITALMNSLLKLDHTKLVDSAILDFLLHPTAVAGEEGMAAFKALVKSYFARGGFALQGNIVNRDMLIEAKADPDRYRNLQVRVCGWNEYFVRMSGAMQDTFIAQLSEV